MPFHPHVPFQSCRADHQQAYLSSSDAKHYRIQRVLSTLTCLFGFRGQTPWQDSNWSLCLLRQLLRSLPCACCLFHICPSLGSNSDIRRCNELGAATIRPSSRLSSTSPHHLRSITVVILWEHVLSSDEACSRLEPCRQPEPSGA